MKTTFFLLVSAVACLVHARPTLRVRQVRLTSAQAGPGAVNAYDMLYPSPNECGANNNVQPAPDLLGSITGTDPASPIAPPPLEGNGDFIVSYAKECEPEHVKYGGCVAYEKPNGHTLNYAKFKELVECFGYEDDACKQLRFPTGAPFPDRLNLPNVLNTGSLLSKSYTCYKLGTSEKQLADPKNLGQNPLANGVGAGVGAK